MTNTSFVYPGLANLGVVTGDSELALYLKMFSGEVGATFARANKLLPMIQSRVVGPGRSHQFLYIGQASTTYHIEGQDLFDPANGYLNSIEHGERTIQPDHQLIAPVMISNWQTMIQHFESRGQYAAELGLALGRKMDQQLFQVMALAAREPATLSSGQATTRNGRVITAPGAATSATTMEQAIIDAAVNLVTKDVPMEELCFFVRPAMYYSLIQNGRLLDRDYGNDGNGSQAMGSIAKGYGFKIYHTNNMPSSVVVADDGERNPYAGDFTDLAALGFHKSAIGSVMRQGVTTETEYSVSRQTTLVVSKITTGHGILRPECAVEISDPDITP